MTKLYDNICQSFQQHRAFLAMVRKNFVLNTDQATIVKVYIMTAVSGGVFVIFAVTLSLIGIAGIVLNGLTLATFLKNRKLLTSSNIFVFSLCLFSFVLSLAIFMNVAANATEGWPFGNTGCKVYAFLTTFCCLSSINHLAGAAFERYDSIGRKSRGRGLLNKRRVGYCLVVLWCYSLVFSIAPLAGWSSYALEGICISCSVNWSSSSQIAVSYTIVLMIGNFVLPFGIIVFSHCNVLKVVREVRKFADTNFGPSHLAAISAHKAKKKSVILFFAITFTFILSWTPYAVVSLISAVGEGDKVSKLSSSVPALLAKSTCVHTPIFYAVIFKYFRKKMLDLIPICRQLFEKKNRVFPDALPKIYYHRDKDGISGILNYHKMGNLDLDDSKLKQTSKPR